MKADLRSKLIDGLLSAVLIMAAMWPLILMFRLLSQWGTVSYWVAAVLIFAAATWTLYRATLEKLSTTGRGWYGIIGGLLGWTIAELSHELNLIDIEQPEIILVLALLIAVLTVLWKYHPLGAKFWIVVFAMNWIGHVFIHAAEEFLVGSAVETLFTVTAVAYILLIIGLTYWIFARSTTRIQRLWGGLWIWHALSMVYFLLR